MDLMTPSTIETLPGTEIIRVDNVWWRVIWADDDEEIQLRIVAGREPRAFCDLLNQVPLKGWRSPLPEVWDFVVETLMDSLEESEP